MKLKIFLVILIVSMLFIPSALAVQPDFAVDVTVSVMYTNSEATEGNMTVRVSLLRNLDVFGVDTFQFFSYGSGDDSKFDPLECLTYIKSVDSYGNEDTWYHLNADTDSTELCPDGRGLGAHTLKVYINQEDEEEMFGSYGLVNPGEYVDFYFTFKRNWDTGFSEACDSVECSNDCFEFPYVVMKAMKLLFGINNPDAYEQLNSGMDTIQGGSMASVPEFTTVGIIVAVIASLLGFVYIKKKRS